MEMTWQGMHVSITTNLSHLIQAIASQQRYAVGNPFFGWWPVDNPLEDGGLWTNLGWCPADKLWNSGLWTSLGMVAWGQAQDGGLWTSPGMVACGQSFDGGPWTSLRMVA